MILSLLFGTQRLQVAMIKRIDAICVSKYFNMPIFLSLRILKDVVICMNNINT